jgi:hypothetical protein
MQRTNSASGDDWHGVYTSGQKRAGQKPLPFFLGLEKSTRRLDSAQNR